MARILIVCILLATLPLSARAEPPAAPAETLIRLNVQAMPAPKPALRYLLLPELKEMQPGNPIPNYLRCVLDQDYSNPTESLSAAALRQVDRAARMDKPDWQILLKAKTDGIGLLLPDVQKIRFLAAALQERFRTEIAQHRIDDALRTAKTMFAMARHMGEHPTLIGDLVGIAIAFVAIGPLDELLAQPGCPNLYWALTTLPNPLISIENGMEGERLLIQSEFREFDDSAPMNAEQLNKLISHIDRLRNLAGGSKNSTRVWLNKRNKDEKLIREARRRLAEVGLSEERVAGFPVDQVLILDEKRAYEESRDDAVKIMNFPTWQVEELYPRIKKTPEDNLFGILLPALIKVRRAQGRLEQRIALLRHVEALRLYAADHDGKVPEKLSDIEVPLSADPFTGKPFRYQREGDTAHLFGSPPPGEEKNPAYNIHYEVTIQKAAR